MRRMSPKDIATMISIITALVLLIILTIVLSFSACATFEEFEKREVVKRELTFTQMHKTKIIKNESTLTSWTKYEKVDQWGIDNESFKRYVMKKIENTGYERFTYKWRTLLTGERRISKACVYYKKREK